MTNEDRDDLLKIIDHQIEDFSYTINLANASISALWETKSNIESRAIYLIKKSETEDRGAAL